MAKENTRVVERREGLAYARAWRARHQAEFDARFGNFTRCKCCGQVVR